MAKGTTGKRNRGGLATETADDQPTFPIPESVQSVIRAKLEFAKQTQQMFDGARAQYHAFAEGVAAMVGVPPGYKLDADAMEFVPAEDPSEEDLTDS